jgi:GTP cyclohydrolase III
MESGSKELSEKMAREEEQRRKEALEMKERLETEKKQQVRHFFLFTFTTFLNVFSFN